MKQSFHLSKFAARLLSGAAVGAVMATGALAQVGDEVVVTSQRTEQSLADVPIAVTALGAEALQDRQIEGFTDIQYNTPNLSFSKNQFTSSTITLRGIAQLATASTSTDSISIHQNDIAQTSSRLFETEFYDVERIEVLRGPQGTLFGRNATGGVINVITANPDPDDVSAAAEAQYGNYNHIKVNGHLNYPINDSLAVRVAGAVLERDGYTENLATGNDIDDRSLYSVRGSLRWYPGENTTVDISASYFEEDDRRSSYQKVRCNSHPILGCATGLVGTPGFETLGFDQAAISGTVAGIASAQNFGAFAAAVDPALAPLFAQFGLFSLVDGAGVPIDYAALQGLTQPTDLRQVAFDLDPRYRADEFFASANIKHDFENFSVKINAGYGDTSVNSIRDADGGVGPSFAVPNFALLPSIPAALSAPGAVPNQPGLAGFFANGLPTSEFGTGTSPSPTRSPSLTHRTGTSTDSPTKTNPPSSEKASPSPPPSAPRPSRRIARRPVRSTSR